MGWFIIRIEKMLNGLEFFIDIIGTWRLFCLERLQLAGFQNHYSWNLKHFLFHKPNSGYFIPHAPPISSSPKTAKFYIQAIWPTNHKSNLLVYELHSWILAAQSVWTILYPLNQPFSHLSHLFFSLLICPLNGTLTQSPSRFSTHLITNPRQTQIRQKN